jgi:antitoxin (DNA-binding transcriptional repressor) of toxin-antitoxin stability system
VKLKTVGIRELKAQLSAYIRLIEAGETVLVTDRGRVVAEIRPPGEPPKNLSPSEVRYLQMVADGRVRPAAAPDERGWAKWRGLGLPAGTAKRLLDAEREE